MSGWISSARHWPKALEAAGFASAERSFFSWLGVVPYLTEAAIFSTLGYIAQLPGGAEVVFDYVNPAESSRGRRPRRASGAGRTGGRRR